MKTEKASDFLAQRAGEQCMFKRTTATIILIAFFSTLVPAPAAFALRQEVADGSAIGGVETELSAAKGAGEEAVVFEGSGMELTDSVPHERRLQFVTFTLFPDDKPELSPAIQRMIQDRPEDSNNMLSQMRAALLAIGVTEEEIPAQQEVLIRKFVDKAVPYIREIAAPLAVKYELDPQAQFVIEWGSRRPAHFHQKGKWEHKIILNLNLLLDPVILKGEILHEVLHPLIRPWAEYIHLENPEFFKAVDIAVEKGIYKPREEGYVANVWDWELRKDVITLLIEAIQTMRASADPGLRQLAESYIKDLEGVLQGEIFSDSTRQTLDQFRMWQQIDRYINTLETSRTSSDRQMARQINIILEERLSKAVESMSRSVETNMQQMARYFKNVLNAKASVEALIEVYIITKELEFYEGHDKAQVINALRDERNIFDREGRLANLLQYEKGMRLLPVIQHLRNEKLYSSKPELVKGASILYDIWQKNPEIIRDVLMTFDARLAELDKYQPSPSITTDDVVDKITKDGIKLIEVRFTDPKGELKGQRKTILMPVNNATLGLLRKGIGFDGSSIHSSFEGRPFAEIFDSDFVVEMVPESLQICKDETTARIDAVVRRPLDRAYTSQKEYANALESIPIANRELHRKQEAEKAMKAIGEYNIPGVKLLVSDWAEQSTMVDVESGKLGEIFRNGIELTRHDTQFLPTVDDKMDFRAIPDPGSLRLIRYADGSAEAVMAVEIVDVNGQSFKGDFRAKLRRIEEKSIEKGFVPYVAPEPEVFFFRRLDDGSLVTADTSGYYDDLRRMPQDIQDVLREVLIAAESCDIIIRYIHHEVAPGQFEMPYEPGPALEVADTTAIFMHIIKTVAKKHNLEACFMPKPISGINGSGMHIHQSLIAVRDVEFDGEKYKKGENIFLDLNGKYHLSKSAKHYIGGLLEYAPGMLRITNPDYNSYLRLVPGYEAPTVAFWDVGNRSAMVRVPAFNIPTDGSNAPAGWIEIRLPDPYGNIHAKFCAVLSAGLMGIDERKNMPNRLEGTCELPSGPNGLEKAIELMNSPEMAPFTDELLGPPGTPVREFLSKPIGIYFPDVYMNTQLAETDVSSDGLSREWGGGIVPLGSRRYLVDLQKFNPSHPACKFLQYLSEHNMRNVGLHGGAVLGLLKGRAIKDLDIILTLPQVEADDFIRKSDKDKDEWIEGSLAPLAETLNVDFRRFFKHWEQEDSKSQQSATEGSKQPIFDGNWGVDGWDTPVIRETGLYTEGGGGVILSVERLILIPHPIDKTKAILLDPYGGLRDLIEHRIKLTGEVSSSFDYAGRTRALLFRIVRRVIIENLHIYPEIYSGDLRNIILIRELADAVKNQLTKDYGNEALRQMIEKELELIFSQVYPSGYNALAFLDRFELIGTFKDLLGIDLEALLTRVNSRITAEQRKADYINAVAAVAKGVGEAKELADELLKDEKVVDFLETGNIASGDLSADTKIKLINVMMYECGISKLDEIKIHHFFKTLPLLNNRSLGKMLWDNQRREGQYKFSEPLDQTAQRVIAELFPGISIKTVAVITDDAKAGNELAEILLEFKEYNFDTVVRTISDDISDEGLQALIDKYKGQDCRVVVKINNEKLLGRFNGYAKDMPVEPLILDGEDRDMWRQRLSQM